MKRILVTEDEQSLRANLEEVLQLENFVTFGAEDGKKALQLAKEKKPDLIISDIQMPRLDGYGFLKALRSDPDIQHLPVIFLTAKADRPDLRRAMDLGADDYLTKPFTHEELLSAIQARLAKQQLVEQREQDKLDELCHLLSYSLPHELNTPLTGMISAIDFLFYQRGQVNETDLFEALETIRISTNRLHRIAQNFLLYADLELKARNLEQEKFQQNDLIGGSSVHHLSALAMAKAEEYNRISDLRLELPEVLVSVSRSQFSKIFEELIDNAFKFSKRGTLVSISGKCFAKMVQLEVHDHGRGMIPEQIESIRAYLQFDRKLYEQQGCGLGLTIAKRLTELLGGSLSIESIPKQETRIYITLPRSH